ncbi:MAG TPA: DUF5931 domain-containing protein [Pseudonocardiaceae bacterium]|jgi:signal transduction histidine kinase|nr:DUF5931 domain-containing protein [Pseudonocardiaceae bacterium]
MTAQAAGPEAPIAKDPLTPWWRAAVVLRLVTFCFALAACAYYDPAYARPTLGWVAIGALGVWNLATAYWYLRENSRWLWLVVVDLVVGCAITVTSRLVYTPDQLHGAEPIPLLTTIWVSGVLATGAIRTGPVGGVLFGVVLAGVNFGTHGYIDLDLLRDAVQLLGIGFVIGLATATARRSAQLLAHALRAEAATAERERLARTIHDSVLQVLARVRRRGADLGGEAAELAQLAGEQEVALRSLVAAAPPESTVDGDVDLRSYLQILNTERVAVAVPGTRVMLPAGVAAELAAVVHAALDNVAGHAGPQARAWVLLEDLGDAVVLSVRDDGPGIPAGRLDQAEAAGRLGVAKSMRGRVGELGGTLALTTAPGQGTEWEFRVPRKRSRRKGG